MALKVPKIIEQSPKSVQPGPILKIWSSLQRPTLNLDKTSDDIWSNVISSTTIQLGVFGPS